MFQQVCIIEKMHGNKSIKCWMHFLDLIFLLQGRVIIVWLSWLIGGICGVVILLVIICYCRLMPRHQKSFGKNFHLFLDRWKRYRLYNSPKQTIKMHIYSILLFEKQCGCRLFNYFKIIIFQVTYNEYWMHNEIYTKYFYSLHATAVY